MREQVRRFLDWVRGALAPDNGRECLAGFHRDGVVFNVRNGAVVGRCVCGFRFASRSVFSFREAINDHLEYRAQ